MDALETHQERSAREILKATKPFVGGGGARSLFDVLSTAMLLAGLLALTLQDIPLYGQAAAGFLAGLVAVRLFVLYHDYQHGAILRRSRLARVFMALYGLLTLNPPSPWNRSHNYHHAHNSTTPGASFGSYPLMTVEAFRRASLHQRLAYLIARHPLTILLGYLSVFLYGMTLRPLLLNPRRHADCGLALLLHGGLIAAFAHWDVEGLIFTLGLPLFVASAMGAYLFYAQHNFPDARFQSRESWDLVTAARRSSSFMRLSPLLNWLTANIGYHQVHHLNPRIPYHRVAEAYAAIPELRDAGRTSLGTRDILRCLRLKLWDVELQRLVPLPKD
ncbi:MAG TPA: fatty acid desaturase [Planctomycetota bacterium]|nr:fatty acid desaturase [Planctomycetota bacterium]